MNKPSDIDDFERGCEHVLRFINSIGGVVQRSAKGMLVLWMVLSVALFLVPTRSYDRYIAWRYIGAVVETQRANADRFTEIALPDGGLVRVVSGDFVANPVIRECAAAVGRALLSSMLAAALSTGVLLVAGIYFLFRFGKKLRPEPMDQFSGWVADRPRRWPLTVEGAAVIVQPTGLALSSPKPEALNSLAEEDQAAETGPKEVESPLAIERHPDSRGCVETFRAQTAAPFIDDDALVFGAPHEGILAARGRKAASKKPSKR